MMSGRAEAVQEGGGDKVSGLRGFQVGEPVGGGVDELVQAGFVQNALGGVELGLENGAEQGFTVRETAVDGRPVHPGGAGDGRHGGTRVLRQEPSSGMEDGSQVARGVSSNDVGILRAGFT